MRISYNRPLLITFTLVVLFSINLSIPQLVQHSEAVPSVYTSEIAAKNNPFHKTSGSDQLIYDYFPSNDKKVTDSGTSNLVNQLINNLVEEKFAKPEICGDGQDNDGNGQVDENCSVGNSPNNSPQGDNQSPQAEPEQEICGDGQDNDGNGQVDENCSVGNSPNNSPQGDNQSPQAEPEQEICGDGQDNDGNGQVDENCSVGNSPNNSPQDNTQLSDEKKNFDKFGVLKIYPTKGNGEQWYLKSNPNDDPQFSPQTTLTKNSDGSFKVKSTKVRMGVFTSSGFHPEQISTLDHHKIALVGYMQSANDWKNVEITGYVKLISGSNDNFVWYARGGRHTGYGA